MDVEFDMPAFLTGDGSLSFFGWVRQLEVAIKATDYATFTERVKVLFG